MFNLFFLIYLVFSLKYVTSAPEECYSEDFEGGSLGIMNKACVKASLFDVKKYKDFNELPRPSGANDYFITPGSDGLSCIDSRDDFKVVIGTELEMSLFTSNTGGTMYAFWLMVDIATGDQLSITPIFIDNSRTWRTSVIKVTKNATVRIKLQSDELKSKNAFMAIDYIKIKGPNAEECIIKSTTTSTTPETTSIDYTENTTPTTVDYTDETTSTTVDYTEETTSTTVDYTENTTPTTVNYTENTSPSLPTTVTPEPPPTSITCNCNCNCNFQCNKNPFS